MRLLLSGLLALLFLSCSSAPMPDRVVERAQTHLEAGRSYQGMWMAWRAARSGNWRAQKLMIQIYSQSDSTYLEYKNVDWARYWDRQLIETQRQAAETGDVDAMAELGLRLMPGWSNWFNEEPLMAADRARGTRLLKEAADQGSGLAHAMLAHPYLFERPPHERIELLQEAAQRGYTPAYRMMAIWMYHPAGDDEQASVVEYVRLLQKGQAAGDEQAVQELETFIGGIERAAANGNATSKAWLQTLVEEGLRTAS